MDPVVTDKQDVTVSADQVIQNPTAEVKKEESPEEINWKKFRQEREKDRQEQVARKKKEEELEGQNKALKGVVEAFLNKQPGMTQEQKETITASIPVGEFTTGKDVIDYVESKLSSDLEKNLDRLLDKREKQREQERRRQEAAELPNSLRKAIPDFDNVCSAQNLDYLEYHHPELAKSLEELPDSYNKWDRVYKAVKRYVPNPDSTKQQARADNNATKPRSVSNMPNASRDEAPRQLDADRKKANFERMQRQMKGLS